MAKTAHSTTAPAPAQPGFIDPTSLPDEYAMRVRGDCLAPAINGGDSVLVDQRQPYAAGDLVCVFLKPECVAPGKSNVGLKRLVLNMMPGITYPYQASPESNIMPVLIAEQDNPPMQYTIPADQILAIHRCLGRVPDDVALYDDRTGEPEYRRAVSAGWSRRDLLAGAATVLPAAGLAVLPVLADPATDPTFAGIEAHRAACERHRHAVAVNCQTETELPKERRRTWITAWRTDIVETDDPRWIAAEWEVHNSAESMDAIWQQFIANPPTTVAGAAALLGYLAELDEAYWPEDEICAFCIALAGALGRIAGGAS